MASKRSESPFERIQLFAPVSAYQGPIFADALAKILSRVKVEIVKRSDQAKGPRDRTSCARFRSCRMLRHPRWSVSWQYSASQWKARIALSVHAAEEGEADTLSLPWTASSPHRRREIIQGANEEVGVARPMPHGARVILIDAIRQAHRWLDNLLSNPPMRLLRRSPRGRARPSGPYG